MARKVFFSFHYKPDNWRASQVRNIGAIEGNKPASDNDWEKVTKQGDKAIEDWINGQMNGRSCSIVLIGKNTKGRKWINYEIQKTWKRRKGLLGIYVHNLKDSGKSKTTKGGNPFESVTVGTDKTKLSSIVKAYNPPYERSTNVFNYIEDNISDWIEEAISIRNNF